MDYKYFRGPEAEGKRTPKYYPSHVDLIEGLTNFITKTTSETATPTYPKGTIDSPADLPTANVEIGMIYQVVHGGGVDANGDEIHDGDSLIYTEKGWELIQNPLKNITVRGVTENLPSDAAIGDVYQVIQGGGTMNEELGMRN